MPSHHQAIDLFAGAGGLAAGLERSGWDTVAAVEIDDQAVATLKATQDAALPVAGSNKTYLTGTRIVHRDITGIHREQLIPAGADSSWRPGLLSGGPPCQPFSSAGRGGGLSDPRGTLFGEFVRLARELEPNFVLFENVRGLVTSRGRDGQPGEVLAEIHGAFEEAGYACRWQLVNSADYGAPQRRVRLMMMGARDRALPKFPRATHARDGGPEKETWKSLGDFLADQPEADSQDVVRPTQRRLSELEALEPGTGIKSKGIVESNRPGGHWGYRQDCFLADETLPSRTIRAASTPDWIRDGDERLRRLTWKEAAGLQGFPSQWKFQGSRASVFRQIGNAVQGNVAEILGRTLLDALRTPVRSRPDTPPWPNEFQKRVNYTEMEERVNGAVRAAHRDKQSRRTA